MDIKMNEPTLLDNAALRRVVDEVMQISSKIDKEFNTFSISAEDYTDEDKVNEDRKVILSDGIIRNEMFTDMWARSLYTCLTDITFTTVPHFEVVQKCLCYILNAESLHFGVAKNLMTKLLFFHPPHTPAMETYYWHILTDIYVSLDYGTKENENLFFTIIKCLSSCLENPVLIKDQENQILNVRDYWSAERTTTTAVNFTLRLYYKHLPVSKQFDRALLIFEFIYEILHKNFVHRMKTNTVHTQRDRCLLSRLFWSRVIDVGVISVPMKKLNRLLVLMGIPSENNIGQSHKKFMTLLAEFYRHIDSEKNFNPFYKNKTCYLASELSLKLYKGLKNQFTTEGVKYLRMVRPYWLRLAVSSKWLGYITCKYCPAEFSSVCEVLKLFRNLITKKRLYRGIYDVRNRNTGRTEGNAEGNTGSNSEIRYCSSDCVFIKRNKSKKMKMSQEDIKEDDCYGWAPLQKAITLGHQKCVENIINLPTERQPDAVDTSLPGYKWFIPMMRCLIKEQGKVCSLLMDHSGHGLFEDINMNSDTPFDIFDDRDIGRIINMGGESSSQPELWQQFHFTPTDIPLVAEVCMILVESYFITYRISDVLPRLKAYKSRTIDLVKIKKEEPEEWDEYLESTANMETNNSEESKEWDYDRYEKDINENLNNLWEMMTQFADKTEIEKSLQPLNTFLHYDRED